MILSQSWGKSANKKHKLGVVTVHIDVSASHRVLTTSCRRAHMVDHHCIMPTNNFPQDPSRSGPIKAKQFREWVSKGHVPVAVDSMPVDVCLINEDISINNQNIEQWMCV